ncbi:H(+)-transporting V0 sector ATPase subunit a [Nowakowskiella sp. JEL0407]|nr:H(+)-transporting V0 sector ATPase subunit a [Nowakowskiella sp. JEL0407]
MVILTRSTSSSKSTQPSSLKRDSPEKPQDSDSDATSQSSSKSNKSHRQHFHLHPFQRKKVVRGNAFISRPSRLDLRTLLSEDNPSRGFFTLFWMAMAFYTVTTLYQNWRIEGTPLKLSFFYHISKDGFGLALSDLALILSCFTSVLITELFVFGGIPRAAILPIQHAWQLSWFSFCVYWVFYRDWPWVQSGFFVMHAIAMLMKQHSYIATNREFLLKRDLLTSLEKKHHALVSDLKRNESDSEETDIDDNAELKGLADEIAQLSTDLNRETVSFPNNVTFWNFADYMVLPTLVYDLEYPRTTVPAYLVEKTCATLGTFALLYMTVEYYILPVLQKMPTMLLSDALMQLLLPFMVCYLLVFYIIFECICNGFAELSGFADREFYDDWWNSSSFDEFARKWNKPVHEFLLRHVFLESLHNLKMSKNDATLFTFLLSALLHELVFAVIGKRIRLYLFVMQMIQLPLIQFARLPMIKKRKLLGNCIFWFGMFLFDEISEFARMESPAMFRSEEMSLVQIYIPLEIAQPTVAELAEHGLIEFRDLNANVNAFQRAFVNEIRRMDEIERQLRFLQSQIDKANIKVVPLIQPLHYSLSRNQQELDEMERIINGHFDRLEQMNSSYEALNKKLIELTELRHVLKETSALLHQGDRSGSDTRIDPHHENAPLLTTVDDDFLESMEHGGGTQLEFITGVVPRQRMGLFERILFRSLRGNLYFNWAEIDEPLNDPNNTDETIEKNVFIVYAHGSQLLTKARKICESLGATLYIVDHSYEKRREDTQEVASRLSDLKQVLDSTQNNRRLELKKVAFRIEEWATIILQEKAIHHTMNLFNYDQGRKALMAEGWCPTEMIRTIQIALRTVSERTHATIPPILSKLPRPSEAPPTYHRTNKFTSGFQAIVDAYGIATYREVNPGLFTTISFPFLFAVMFGDFGQGFLVFLFACWMCSNERKLAKNKWGEIWDMIFGGRYVILLMGAFSIFTGLMYNDVFSRPVRLFESKYDFVQENPNSTLAVGIKKDGTYPFGLDPAWLLSENKLIFLNSYKMKMAIILGFIQMMFGISLQIVNHRFFKRPQSIYAETLPQIIMMCCIIGYLVFIVILKWCMTFEGRTAPSILNTLIFMFLAPGKVEKSQQLFSGQSEVQMVLLITAGLCIPWMLVGKPYLVWKESQQHHDGLPTARGGYRRLDVVNGDHDDIDDDFDDMDDIVIVEEHHDFSEVVVHSILHTIEFVLSCISYTASYLRLWALSLAHAQLSEVLWDMVMGNVFLVKGEYMQVFALMLGYYFWLQGTIGLLICMEGLSAFLHALRLHWVEFNSKFYEGQGRKFQPFSFEAVMKEREEGSE